MDPKAKFVRNLFSGIPREYDQLLWMLTLRQDARWRRRAILESGISNGARILDLATGTGVFGYDWIDRIGRGVQVFGLDITPAMVEHAAGIRVERGLDDPIHFLCGRTEGLPFPDHTFEIVSIGLALRNLSSLEESFHEMARVTRPGGKVISVDFTRPTHPLFRRIYYLYLCRGLPLIGQAISREWHETFEYLWRSILDFRSLNEVVKVMMQAGLQKVRQLPMTGGIATILVGEKP